MKSSKINEELKQSDIAALSAKLIDLRRELFTLRLNAATAHVKDYSQYKKIRRNIARVLTYVRQMVS